MQSASFSTDNQNNAIPLTEWKKKKMEKEEPSSTENLTENPIENSASTTIDMDSIAELENKMKRMLKWKTYMASQSSPSLASDPVSDSFVPASASTTKCGSTPVPSSPIEEPFEMFDIRSIQDNPVVKNISDKMNRFADIVLGLLLKIPNKIDQGIDKICHAIVEGTDKKEKDSKKDNDKKVLRQTIYFIIFLPVTLFVACNLYFVMYFKHTNFDDSDNEIKEPVRPANNSKRISFTMSGWKYEEIWTYFFKFLIRPLNRVDSIFFGDNKGNGTLKLPKNKYIESITLGIPYYLGFLPPTVAFSVLFFMAILIMQSKFLSIIGLIRMVQSSTPAGWFLRIISIVHIIMWIIGTTSLGYSFFYGKDISVQTIILYLFLIVGSLVVAFFSGKITAILILLYLSIHFFFGMLIYGNDNIFMRYYYGFKYVWMDLNKKVEGGSKIQDFLKRHSISLVMCIYLLYLLIYTSVKLKCPNLMTGYTTLMCILLAFIVVGNIRFPSTEGATAPSREPRFPYDPSLRGASPPDPLEGATPIPT